MGPPTIWTLTLKHSCPKSPPPPQQLNPLPPPPRPQSPPPTEHDPLAHNVEFKSASASEPLVPATSAEKRVDGKNFFFLYCSFQVFLLGYLWEDLSMGCSFRKGIFIKMRNNYLYEMAIPLDKKLTKQWNYYSIGISILFQGFISHIKTCL